MVKITKQNNVTFKKKRPGVAIPNCAIDELQLATLGFYGRLLDRVTNENVVFKSKEELILDMMTYSYDATRKKAEKAWDELVKEGYILYSKDETGENIEVTYGPYGRIGEQ